MLSLKSPQTQKLSAIRSKLYLCFLVIGIGLLSTRGIVLSYKYPDSFEAINKKISDNDLVTLNDEENLIYSIAIFELEMNKGGFDQYFFNTSGSLDFLTLESLEKVGATKTKSLLEQAIQIAYDGDIPSDWDERQEKLLNLDKKAKEKLNELDEAFYKYEENIEELVNAYLNK